MLRFGKLYNIPAFARKSLSFNLVPVASRRFYKPIKKVTL